MFKTKFRLKWKDINFLIRKRKYFSAKFFGFFYFDQYPNLKFNQISINIPLKYHKKAVHRVSIKRAILRFLKENWYEKKDINTRFYKIFISLNKKNIWELKNQIERFDKADANNYILKQFKNDFLFFLSKIWK